MSERIIRLEPFPRREEIFSETGLTPDTQIDAVTVIQRSRRREVVPRMQDTFRSLRKYGMRDRPDLLSIT